jgi:phage FluMu protein Com
MSKGVFEAKCTECGKLFLVPPIGEEYVEILQQHCERGDSISIERRCPWCDKINTIIYHRSHDLPFKRDPSTDTDLAGQP